jgi:hypothetical protein
MMSQSMDAELKLLPRRRLLAAIAAPVAALAAVFSLAAAWLVLEGVSQQRLAAEAADRRLVNSVMSARASALRDAAIDYAIWDDAYRATTVRWDAEWLRRNYHSSIFDATIVFRNGQMRFLWSTDEVVDGRGALARDAMQTVRAIAELEALPARPRSAETAVSALTVYRNELALIAVAPIAWEDDAARIARAARGEPQNFFLGVRVLDSQDVAELGPVLGLDDFHFDAAPAADISATSWPISEMGAESSARFVWRPAPHGNEHVRLLALVFAGIVGACACAIWAAHALLRRSLGRTETA